MALYASNPQVLDFTGVGQILAILDVKTVEPVAVIGNVSRCAQVTSIWALPRADSQPIAS